MTHKRLRKHSKQNIKLALIREGQQMLPYWKFKYYEDNDIHHYDDIYIFDLLDWHDKNDYKFRIYHKSYTRYFNHEFTSQRLDACCKVLLNFSEASSHKYGVPSLLSIVAKQHGDTYEVVRNQYTMLEP